MAPHAIELLFGEFRKYVTADQGFTNTLRIQNPSPLKFDRRQRQDIDTKLLDLHRIYDAPGQAEPVSVRAVTARESALVSALD
jgi:hypothetical protein